MTLPAPARYFPIERRRYEVAPGLRALGTPFGNGEADGQVFQLDRDFPRYREEKLRARAGRLGKHCCDQLTQSEAAALARFMAARLAQEHPRRFGIEGGVEGAFTLRCALTGEALRFDAAGRFAGAEARVTPPYAGALDALAAQVQEDLAVMRQAPGGGVLAGIHLCFANHWAAEKKIGRDFAAVHAPVAGIEPVSRAAAQLVEAMVKKGPYVRFAWGVASDARLDHHPEPPSGVDAAAWRGRRFAGGPGERLYLRVERQVTWGFPQAGAALFTIRTYFVDCGELRGDARKLEQLTSALRSMTPEQRRYKGLAGNMEEVLAWLERRE